MSWAYSFPAFHFKQGGIMTVLIAIFSFYVGVGSYIVAPDLYSHEAYEYTEVYNSLEACQIDSHGTGSICTTEAPYQKYVVADPIPTSSSTAELIFIPCDYWAGCYTQED
jgi:hypothetical protein|tara:strand:+ start:113 stop:442 length:330 start_codon:yes stop_codon:yes gene_type:complete